MQTAAKITEIPHFHAFPSREALAESLAKEVAAELRAAIASRGLATLVVSGGSTPKPFFVALQHEPLDWSCVLVTVADERWVPTDHEDSNEKLVQECLLALHERSATSGASGEKLEARFISLYNDAPTAMSGEETAEQAIRSMILPFDVTILGMGPDGHTASLFPQHPRLEDALETTQRLCMGIENAPKPPPERMTLTKHALLQSRRLMLHITGEDKQDVLREAMKNDDALALPIRAFLHQEDVPLEIYWAA